MKTTTNETLKAASTDINRVDLISYGVEQRMTWDEVVHLGRGWKLSQRCWRAYLAAMAEEWG